jgi:hypothetical protein
MKKVIFAALLFGAAGMHAQTLNVNYTDGTYLPVETADTREITFDEAQQIVTLTLGGGERHSFYTGKVESLSPKSDKKTMLTYDLDPEVSFSSSDALEFEEIIETIPADELDPDYGDYVEKFSVGVVVEITFSENDVTVKGTTSDITYTKSGAHLTIDSQSGKVGYIVSGKSSNGSLKIYSLKKFQMMLDGLELTNPKGPAINIQTGKTIYFTLGNGTTNTLCDGETYNAPVIGADGSEEDQKGTLFSEGQLIVNGTGTLNVTSHGGHGICSDDYIRIRSGNINILGAAKDGFHTNDKFIVNRTENSTPVISVKSAADGIDCGKGFVTIDAGKIELTTGGEAIKVEYEEAVPDTSVVPDATINGGYLKFTTTGEKSSGIKTTGVFTLNGGIIQGTVKGNGSKLVNSDRSIAITGGKLTGFAEGTVLNDTTSAGGMKCEGDVKISGGEVAIECSGKGAKGINCRNVSITGGDVTILSIAGNHTARKSIAVDANNFTVTNGRTELRGHTHAVSATKVTLVKGTLHAISDSDTAIDATIKQSGGWLMSKDAE